MSDIYFKCSCGKNIAVEASGVGRRGHCPDCGAGLVIPDASIEWHCPRCGVAMQAPAEMAGEWVQCLACSSKIQVAEVVPPEPEAEPEPEIPAPAAGPPGGNLLTGMNSFFKQCPQCHERIPVNTQQCPFCEYSFTRRMPKGVVAGVLCGVIAAGIFLGLWQAEIWPFNSGRPPVPVPAVEIAAPTVAELLPESNTVESAPLATAGTQEVSLATNNIPGSMPESTNTVASQDEWLARIAISRQFISARLDKACPRCATNAFVSLRQIDGLVINGTHAGVESGGMRLVIADKPVFVEFKNLDAYDRLQADDAFRAAWIDAQALALSRRSLEQEGLKLGGLPANGKEFSDQALVLGDPQAQYQMGKRYYRQKDYATAFLFLLAAAAQQNAPAQYSLGVIYFQGLGVGADQKQCLKWMALAAAQGHAEAEQFLQQRKVSAEVRQKLLQQDQARQDKEAQAFKAFRSQSGPQGLDHPAGFQ